MHVQTYDQWNCSMQLAILSSMQLADSDSKSVLNHLMCSNFTQFIRFIALIHRFIAHTRTASTGNKSISIHWRDDFLEFVILNIYGVYCCLAHQHFSSWKFPYKSFVCWCAISLAFLYSRFLKCAKHVDNNNQLGI